MASGNTVNTEPLSMSKATREALSRPTESLGNEFAEKLAAVEKERDLLRGKHRIAEKERDEYKSKYERAQKRVNELQQWQENVEVAANDVGTGLAFPVKASSVTKERRSPSPEPSIPSSSTSYETLQRKYNTLNSLYQKSKFQVTVLKMELSTKNEQWRNWKMWWDEKKAGLRLKSTPIEPTPGPIDELLPPEDHIDWDGGMTKVEGEEDVMEVDEGAKCGDDEDENMTHLEKFAVERFRPDADQDCALDRAFEGLEAELRKDAQKQTHEPEPEIIKVPESPAVPTGRTIHSSQPRTAASGKSAQSNKRSRPNVPTLSTRTSDPNKKRKTKYPNMKYFTEDGTDGINPRSPPQNEEDEEKGGMSVIAAMLENPPSQPYRISTSSTSTPSSTKSMPTIKSESKSKPGEPKNRRIQELIDISSDSETGKPSTPADKVSKRPRMEKANSEPRLRRELLSPDLKVKNKGRGRYSMSALPKYVLLTSCPNGRTSNEPNVGDFVIDPDKNYGVSHPFNEVVRGKEARKSLTAAPCPQCAKFYELHGPCEGVDQPKCTHIDQVGRHRQIWHPEERPPGFWNSDFPTTQEVVERREAAEKQERERVRKIAADAATGNGRWKRRDTNK